MAGHMVAFSGFLKDAGLPTHPRAVADACRSVAELDLGDPQQTYWAIRANFLTDRRQYEAFDQLYRLFWREGVRRLKRDEGTPSDVPGGVRAADEAEGEAVGIGARDREASGGASAEELLLKKDLRHLAPGEEPELRGIFQSLLSKLATRPGRRYRPGRRGRSLEFRRIFRENTRFGGEILRLVYRKPKLTRRRVAFLGDVSGSMDVYSRFFLLMAHGLALRDPGVEVFAFSTRLFRLSEFLREPDTERAMVLLGEKTKGWSEGTKIGQALLEFNEQLRQRTGQRETVVVVFSDGWDRGDPDLLRRELVRLKGAVRGIYWLNPLKGDVGYQPLCRGMATALPYLDGFFAAHNLESLARFAKRIARLR
jgi:uncharacterized protein with von Willebrand factor type A (vWA) domain